MLRQHVHPLLHPLVSGVHVVALGQRDRRGADKVGVDSVDRASGIAQHAVDAHGVLLVFGQLLWRLEVLPFFQGLLRVPDDPWFYGAQLFHGVSDVSHQVTDHRKSGERLDPNGSGKEALQVRRAREDRAAIHHHATTAADTHAARPPVGQSPVQLVLDVVEPVENHPLGVDRNLEALPGGLHLFLGAVAQDLHRHGFGHRF